jgi:hypothetical protein
MVFGETQQHIKMVYATVQQGLIDFWFAVQCHVGTVLPTTELLLFVLQFSNMLQRLVQQQIMKNAVIWDVTPCGSCKNRRFGGT